VTIRDVQNIVIDTRHSVPTLVVQNITTDSCQDCQ